MLGPLATFPEPHCYDLCARHANRLTVPSGWNLIRGGLDDVIEEPDELHALMDAVREERPARRDGEAPAVRQSPAPLFDGRVRLSALPDSED